MTLSKISRPPRQVSDTKRQETVFLAKMLESEEKNEEREEASIRREIKAAERDEKMGQSMDKMLDLFSMYVNHKIAKSQNVENSLPGSVVVGSGNNDKKFNAQIKRSLLNLFFIYML